jgi:cytochrome c-type biogenesis protein CcmH/NrfG
MITAFPSLIAAQEALDASRYQEAAQIALEHVRAHPDDPRGLGLLGTVAMRTGALGQAEQFLLQALKRAPNDSRILHELASCLQQQERPIEALEVLGQLEASNRDDPQVGLMIGLLLDKLGRAEEATQRFEVLTAKHPSNINLWLALAHNLRSSGRTDDAVMAYRRAAGIEIDRGDAWWGIASIKKKVFTDDDMVAMEKALAVAIDVRNVAPLHFSIARGYHDRKQYEQAFHHYSEGNRLRAESIGYEANELTEEVDEYIQTYDRTFFEQQPEFGADPAVPIFIVSLPRSGSTLLEQMLGSHPDIEPAGELPYIPALLREVMVRHTRRGPVTIPQMIKRIGDAEAKSLSQEYLRRTALHCKRGVGAFIDKLPHNWSNIHFVRRILPQARFIDIRRSAMDCCFSNFTQSFSRAHAASFALADIGQCYADYVRLMDHLEQVAPGLVHQVRYERLIEQPASELTGIFSYLGIEWDDAPLNFHQLDRVVRTPSAEQVRRPLNREGVGAWKPYSKWLGPLRDALGPLAQD